MSTLAEPTHHRWIVVAHLSAISFVLYIDRINISVSAPSIATEFGLSSQSLGYILSAFLFGYAFGLVPGGWLADRFGPRKVLAIAAACWGFVTLLAGLVHEDFLGKILPSGTLFFVIRFVLGLTEACAFPTFARALANWMRQSERAFASGLIHAGGYVGGILSPMLIAFIVAHFGWRYSFFVSGTITLAVTLLWWQGATDHPSQHKRVSQGELLLIGSQEEILRAENPDWEWYRQLVRSRNAYWICASSVFYGISGAIFLTWFYIYFVKVRGAGTMYSAVLTSFTYAAGALAAPMGGTLCDLSEKKWGAPWGRRIVPLGAISASGLFCIVAPLISNNTVSAVVFALAAGLQYLAAPAFWATIIDVTRRGPGFVGGLMNGSGNIGAAIATLAFPWLVSFLDWQVALQIAGSTGIVSGLIWLLIDSSQQIDAEPARPQAA